MSKIDNILATATLALGLVVMVGATYGIVRVNEDITKSHRNYEDNVKEIRTLKQNLLNKNLNKGKEA